MKISAIIVTKNEAANIARCLESLTAVADEIVVVDAYSQDATSQICESFPNVNFISCPWIGLEGMKRLGRQVARYEHIMTVAADEVLSPELQHNLWYIKQNLKNETIAMVNYVGGASIQIESASENTPQTNSARYSRRQSARDNFPAMTRSSAFRKPKFEDVW